MEPDGGDDLFGRYVEMLRYLLDGPSTVEHQGCVIGLQG
jgi:hypothetical protein